MFVLAVIFAQLLYLAAACDTGRLYVGTVNESYPEHVHVSGVYVRLHNFRGARPVYKQEHRNVYLYHTPGFIDKEGFWVIGPKLGGHTANIAVVSDAEDPTQILNQNKWYLNTSSGWAPLRRFKVKCVPKTFIKCSSQRVKLSGLSPFNKFQQKRMGIYELQKETHQFRPVYRHEVNGEYLYYLGGFWVVGPTLGEASVSLFVYDFAFRAEYIVHQWTVFTGQHFLLDSKLKLTCVGGSLMERDRIPLLMFDMMPPGMTLDGDVTPSKSSPPAVSSAVIPTTEPETADISSTLANPPEKSQEYRSVEEESSDEQRIPISKPNEQNSDLEKQTHTSASPEPQSNESKFTTQIFTTLGQKNNKNRPDKTKQVNKETTTPATQPLEPEEELSELDVIHPCELNPCHRGGTCIPESDTTFMCNCRPGFYGLQCERDIRCKRAPSTVNSGNLTLATGVDFLDLAFYSCEDPSKKVIGICTMDKAWKVTGTCLSRSGEFGKFPVNDIPKEPGMDVFDWLANHVDQLEQKKSGSVHNFGFQGAFHNPRRKPYSFRSSHSSSVV